MGPGVQSVEECVLRCTMDWWLNRNPKVEARGVAARAQYPRDLGEWEDVAPGDGGARDTA